MVLGELRSTGRRLVRQPGRPAWLHQFIKAPTEVPFLVLGELRSTGRRLVRQPGRPAWLHQFIKAPTEVPFLDLGNGVYLARPT